ncbi:hypothetical protein [Chachezhania sediminis]|uniref:hypothetical protein n=1 Tax=Chachezhania sediminis TaxID=2599291 RepID=UPI00131C2085|nr:hypothetical protein [Chachezhania sediminis]
MTDDAANELIEQMMSLSSKLDTLNARQDEANDIMRGLIDALNTNSQELLELRQDMQKKR